MKQMTTLTKAAIVIILTLGLSYITNAATYTATASGNWSSSATWGGNAPGLNITGVDAIIIPVGTTVTLDESVAINNALASLTVTGSLTGSADLTLAAGTLTGAGTVNIGQLNVGAAGLITSTGSITVGNFSNSSLLLSLGSTINTTNITLASGTIQLNGGGIINIANSGTIVFAGGNYILNGGALNLAGTVNLTYSGSSATIGVEAQLPGVQNVSVNLPSSSSQINLSGQLTVTGTLNLQQGVLNLNNNNIIINGGISTSATGSIASSASSNITFNGNGNVGTIAFAAGANTVGQLSLNITGCGSVALQSDLLINGNLALNNGTLQVGNNSLTIGGNISGSGYIGTTLNSSLAFTGSGSVGTLMLSGSTVGNLMVDISTGSLTLGNDLTVNSNLSIANGTLVLNGYNLTVNGSVSIVNTGSIGGNASSDITINGNANSTLTFDANSAVSDLTVNVGSGNALTLGSNVTVGGALTLQSGSLSLNGFNLAINGTVNSSGGGTLTGHVSSNVTVTGTGSVGTITLAGSGTAVNNLTVNISGGGSVAVSGNLTVGGQLQLTGGVLALNTGSTLTINGTIAVGGSGTITAGAGANITIGGSGNVGTLVLTSGSTTVGNLTVNIGGGGSVSLGSDILVGGSLSLNDGSLNLNGFNLTIAGTVSTSAGGTLTGNSASSVIVLGSGNIGSIAFAAGGQTINNLTINASTGGIITLGSNATVTGTLSLTRGKIDIGNYDLSVTSSTNIQGGSASSYIVTSGTGSLVMSVGNAGATANFQVGTALNFAPVIVTNSSSSAGSFSVKAHAGVFANGNSGVDLTTTESAVNTSWDVETDITTGTNVALEAFWNAAMEVNGFNRSKAYLSHYINSEWDVTAQAQATAHAGGMYSIKRSGINSFSPFAVFDNNTTTGVTDLSVAKKISIYPNPANNFINVSVPDAAVYNKLHVYDAIGNEVYSSTLSNALTSIDISQFNSGVYILSINNSVTGRFTKK